jgi:hypothetical protein
MQCECQLPCRDEPVTEADAYYCTAFLLVCAAVSVFLIFAGQEVEIWMPLGAGAALFSCFGRHYDVQRFHNQSLQNPPPLKPPMP